jgi:hypothetical protein
MWPCKVAKWPWFLAEVAVKPFFGTWAHIAGRLNSGFDREIEALPPPPHLLLWRTNGPQHESKGSQRVTQDLFQVYVIYISSWGPHPAREAHYRIGGSIPATATRPPPPGGKG